MAGLLIPLYEWPHGQELILLMAQRRYAGCSGSHIPVTENTFELLEVDAGPDPLLPVPYAAEQKGVNP